MEKKTEEKTLQDKEHEVMNSLLEGLTKAIKYEKNEELIDWAHSYKLIHEAMVHRMTAKVFV